MTECFTSHQHLGHLESRTSVKSLIGKTVEARDWTHDHLGYKANNTTPRRLYKEVDAFWPCVLRSGSCIMAVCKGALFKVMFCECFMVNTSARKGISIRYCCEKISYAYDFVLAWY